ncbi:hypothetical protein K456DRAFT_463240 [Colletotrichum gloeosporioides 23]|nr:hypothetical protein K456DRAFT_463240 [Colletotrichum gloeosporioides 23]
MALRRPCQSGPRALLAPGRSRSSALIFLLAWCIFLIIILILLPHKKGTLYLWLISRPPVAHLIVYAGREHGRTPVRATHRGHAAALRTTEILRLRFLPTK